MTTPTPQSRTIEAAGLTLHYLEAGRGDPVLLLHGWPTSSHLWRGVMPEIARTRRVIALDLPGFGRSDKPPGASYSFRFYDRVLEAFVKAVGVERTSLVVHDLGGPIGLYWALAHPERLDALVLTNTLVYPESSWAVKLFVLATYAPGVRDWLASASGIRFALRLGVERKAALTPEVLGPYQQPFRERAARRALLAAGHGLHPGGFREIARRLPEVEGRVLCLYGENDRILPDVAETMARVRRDLPQAEVQSLPGCGHFLQEDAPDEVGHRLATFLGASGPRREV